MNTLIASQNSLYWGKLGKWQVLAATLILAVFFITRHFTSDNGDVFVITALVGFAAVAITSIVSYPAPGVIVITALVGFAVVVVALLAFAVFTATLVFSHVLLVFFVVISAVIVLGVVAESAITSLIAAAGPRQLGCANKIVLWLSFVAEFIAILLLLLWLA
ncbi:MAG: hypothetical protein WC465_04440 [Patescibacteria group bacterium]